MAESRTTAPNMVAHRWWELGCCAKVRLRQDLLRVRAPTRTRRRPERRRPHKNGCTQLERAHSGFLTKVRACQSSLQRARAHKRAPQESVHARTHAGGIDTDERRSVTAEGRRGSLLDQVSGHQRAPMPPTPTPSARGAVGLAVLKDSVTPIQSACLNV